MLVLVLTFCMMGPLQGATLERLSLDDMIAQATSIVRAKVAGSRASYSGPVIYTRYTLQVSETFKGSSQSSVEIAVPGGSANNYRQTFAGTPKFSTGSEYVFFLWTGRNGLTQVIGLTQGLFSISETGSTDPLATRAASRELMLQGGQPVKDETILMRLSALRSRIAARLGTAAQSGVQK